MEKCPCHSELLYADCCERLHQGALPKNALELMRSRYSAYAKGLTNYILSTMGRKHSPTLQELKEFCTSTQFKGLEILMFEEHGDTAHVAFVAYLQQGGFPCVIAENSSFQKQREGWIYLEGKLYPSKEALLETLSI